MRLTVEQRRTIREQVEGFLGGGAELFVYGSRLDDEARGGDVDLLVRTAQPVDMLDQARLHARLEEALQLPVDLLFVAEGAETTYFKRMICAQAQPLAA
jgi:predicted nucleotidyltransferase